VAIKVDIPIQLEVGAELLRADASSELAARLAEVVTRNLEFMAGELAADGHHGKAAFDEPKLQWTGPGVGALSAADRARAGARLLHAVREACRGFAAASASARFDPGGDWRIERFEFVAVFDRVLGLVESFAWNRADELRIRYADHASAQVHGVAWVVTAQRRVSWSLVHGAVNAERRRDLGDETLFGYFWDAARTEELRGLDPKHLRDLPRLAHEEMAAPRSGTALWQLAPGTRVVFVAAAHPEVSAEAYVELGRAVTVQVPLHEALTAVNGVLDVDRLQQVYQLGEQAVLDLLQHDPDAELAVWVLPFAIKRRISGGPLHALLIDHAAELRAPASPLDQVRPLGPGARDALPRDVTAPGLALGQGKPTPPDHIGHDPWQPGWTGVYLRPILDRDQLRARAGYAHEVEQFDDEAARVAAMLDLRNGILSAARQRAVWTWTARWLNARPEAFDLLLAAVDRRGVLARLFASWLEEKLYPSRLRVLIRLCLRTRYGRHPGVRALIAAVEHWEVAHLDHDYDVDAQQIRLFHDDATGHRITAAGASTDPSAGVVAETRSYYSKQTKIKKLNKDALEQLAEPVRRKAGAMIGAMICEGNDGMTADEVIARATQEVSSERKFTDADYEIVPLRLSLRVLRLERRPHDGVTDVVVHWVPVRQIGVEPWTPTGKPVAGPPAQFEAALTSYHVDHMMEWVVTPIVLGGAILLTGGAALAAGVGVGELAAFIVLNELMYVISNWHEGVTLNGFLMAAWMAEIEAIGFKGVSSALGMAGELGLDVAGKLFTRIALRLGSEVGAEALTIRLLRAQATKWILFLLRGGATGVAGGASAVLGLLADDLLMMSRCKGWSSREDYWQRFKIGVLVGAAIEIIAVPLLAPLLRPLLEKAGTVLEVVKILRKSGKSFREISRTLLSGVDAMEQALGRALRDPNVTGKLAKSFRERMLDVLRTWGREYQTRAYSHLLAVLDEELGARATRALGRLLGHQTEHEVDELLARIAGGKHIATADLLDLLADLDDEQLARLLARDGAAQLAESPALLGLLRRTPQPGWRLLAEQFDHAVADCEAYVARFAGAPADRLDRVIELLLLRGKLIPRDQLADAVLHHLGSDPVAATRWFDVLGSLDERVVAALARRGQLPALAGSRRALELLSARPRAALGILEAFDLDVASAERFLTELDQVPAAIRDRGMRLFDGGLDSAPGLAGRLARRLGGRLFATVVPDGGMVTISGELTIAPSRLAELSDDELTRLLEALDHPGDPASAGVLKSFEDNPKRLRFRSRVAAKVDPWVGTMLREAGFAEGSPEYELFRQMSESDRQELWDLPGNRGRDPDIRPQAARWALGRQHTSVHRFNADFQFYRGEVEHQTELIRDSLRKQVNAALRDAQAAQGARPLSDPQIQAVYRRITQQPPAPGGQGGLGKPFPKLDSEGATRAMRQRAIEDMRQPGAGGRTRGELQADAAATAVRDRMVGDYAIAETRIPGPLERSTLVAQVRERAAMLHFGDVETAAYHAHVHVLEIPDADIVMGSNEVETYLNTTRETIRSGAADPPVRTQDGAWAISFQRGRGLVVVEVTSDGVVTAATYTPRKS
jgi:hypothetical protein